MLDGLLNRGFSSKCKSLIKASRARIEVIRKRAEAKQRFLKEDLAKLLLNGLDINAFGRTEEYVAGLNLLSCYDFIEQTCEYIVKQLSRMQKQGECPEECREAVGSLMFAAARFSDLPELRELRDTCQHRYGNLDVFVNQKFVEKLSKDPPSSAKKIEVLQDIASEFSIRWDSRGFEQRMATPLAVPKVDVKKIDAVTPRPVVVDEKHRINTSEGNAARRDKYDHVAERQERVHYREKSELKSNSPGDDEILSHGKHTQTANKYTYLIEAKELKAEKSSSSSHGKTFDNGTHSGHGNGFNYPRKIENTEALFRERTELAPKLVEYRAKSEIAISSSDSNQDGTLNSMRKGSERPKSSSDYALPPPYVKKSKDDITPPPYSKPKEGKQRENRVSKHSTFDVNGHSGEPSSYKSSAGRILNELDHPDHRVHQNNTLNSIMKGPDRLQPSLNYALPPPYVKSKDKIAHPTHIKPEDHLNPFSCKTNVANSSSRSYQEPNHPKYDIVNESAKARIYGNEKDLSRHGEKISLPKPRSSRRKHHKPSSYDADSGFEDFDAEKRGSSSSSSRRKHHKPSSYDADSGFEDVDAEKRGSSSSSRRKDPSRKGLQTMFDEEHIKKDDEEKMIDKLLIHYSKKPSSIDAGKLRKKHGQAPNPISTDDDRNREVVVPHPSRSVSLPNGQAASPESKRLLTRVNTFQPDNAAKHVHPKLPDYDDLAARFAALRGR